MTEDTVRCPVCRGSKKVAKLGGVVGDCNLCGGKGHILTVDKPKTVVAEKVEVVGDIVSQVRDAVKDVEIKFQPEMRAVILEDEKVKDVKVDPKRALYRKKRA